MSSVCVCALEELLVIDGESSRSLGSVRRGKRCWSCQRAIMKAPSQLFGLCSLGSVRRSGDPGVASRLTEVAEMVSRLLWRRPNGCGRDLLSCGLATTTHKSHQ